MRSTTTSNLAIHSIVGWRERLGCCQSRRLTPLGLILMLFALFVPNIASAEIVTTTYDFTDKGDKVVTYGDADATYTNCNYFTKIGNVSEPGRFAAQGAGAWVFERQDRYGNWGDTPGFCNNNSGGRRFLVSKLYVNDVVTFDVVNLAGASQTISLDGSCTIATANGNTFTMSAKGSLVVTISSVYSIKSITIQHDNSAAFAYDPAVETYELNNSMIQSGQSSLLDGTTGYNIAGGAAHFIANPNNYALNNRIAVQNTDFQWGGGLKTTKGANQYRILSINDLKADDRVVITYSGNAIQFGTSHTNVTDFAAANIVFKDVNNNGEREAEDGETYPEAGETVESGTAYTMEQDGHLDIRVPGGATITKIEIYCDHQANMVDRYNGQGLGNNSYFNNTGQLEAKHHIVPGGLHVYVGNTNDAQHAEVQASDKGPVSYVYDQNHFKMARQESNSTNATDAPPATGTFYMFEPDVNGTMTVNFKAFSVKYDNMWANDARGGEHQTDDDCPYFLMVKDANNNYTRYTWPNGNVQYAVRYDNNGDGSFANVPVTAGNTYYVFGWWDNPNDFSNSSCGVAELIDVTFIPQNYIYPLAKWVESGATADDLTNLADVQGYTDVCIKKKSDNIESVTAAIENGKLKITSISYKAGTNPGGVVLIKVGNRWNDADPVFVLTIAYDAAFNMNSETGRTEGYIWNFSDQPLHGLKWNNRWGEADVTDFGTRFNGFATAAKDDNGVPTNGINEYSFLTEEINNGDWTFNYRVKKNGQFHDPRFLNNYDMEGDNADMMWDTQGIIINAGSTQSCIFNEFSLTSDRVIDHTNKTQADPDRYVGFLPGGSFIIPKLKKDDRVIVYMGSGEGSGAESMEFHITNARDAVYNEIAPEDFYHAGGSMWNVPDGHNDPYYRGCYHFFALDDGDMVFEMTRGTMCKLYEIRIYRGTRYGTNGVQENGGGYTILAEKDQSGNVTTSETKSWNLHFRGKGERVADGSGKFSQENEVLAHSGNIENLELVRLSSGQGIEYTNVGEIGMLRVRVKCMEFNFNYVTDFADRNFTLALHETQSYPYTWDFTDVDLFSGYGDQATTNNILGEYQNYNELEYDETNWYEPTGRELSMWDEDGYMILYGPYSTDQATVYQNQNMIFENSKGINGNQLYANGDVIPETKGLWFYFDNNDPAYSGSTQITADGLRLSNTKRDLGNSTTTMGWWNTKMVVPNVPSGAAVYARVIRDASVGVADYSQKQGEDPVYFLSNKYQFGHMSAKADIADGTNCRFYKVEDKTAYEANDNEDEYIIAILNTGETSNLTFTLNGWIVKKLSVSVDPKAVNIKGWTTESRSRVIDPELTAYLTGYDFETCLVTGFDKEKRTVTLSRVYDPTAESNDALVMRSFTANGQNGANIIHNIANEEVSILSNGFHLFVPDMHDYIASRTDGITNQKDITDGDSWRNLLVSQVTAGTIPNKETRTWKYSESDAGESLECTNYSMSYRYYVVDQAGNIIDNTVQEGDEAFYRIVIGGANSSANKGYLPLPTRDMTNKKGEYANMYTLVYEGEETPDAIQDVTNFVNTTGNNVFYTIDGQKLNGVPTTSGIYIVNGKKVVIK